MSHLHFNKRAQQLLLFATIIVVIATLVIASGFILEMTHMDFANLEIHF